MSDKHYPADGRSPSFDQVFNEHYDRVCRLAYSLCGNSVDAEDIAQDVFMGVLKGLGSFRGDSNISTWVYRITTRAAARHLSRRKSQVVSQKAEVATEPDGAEKDVVAEQFIRDLNKLSIPQRTILSLVVLEGLSHQAVADVLGIPVGTVWSRLHEARKQLSQRPGTE